MVSPSLSGPYYCVTDIFALLNLALNQNSILYFKWSQDTINSDSIKRCLKALYWNDYSDTKIPTTSECAYLVKKYQAIGVEQFLDELLVLSNPGKPLFAEIYENYAR